MKYLSALLPLLRRPEGSCCRIVHVLLCALVAGGCGASSHGTRDGSGTTPAADGAIESTPATDGAVEDVAESPRVWDTQQRQWLTTRELRARLQESPLILLGELHDDRDHHLRQAEVLRWLVDGGRQPAVVFEMFDITQQADLNAETDALVTAEARADALAERVDWDGSGWPPWQLYRPIFVEVFRHHLPMVAANLPRSAVHAMVHGEGVHGDDVHSDGVHGEGIDLDAAWIERYALDRPLPEPLQQALLQELDDAHCGMLPQAMHGPMARVQRTRDALMAEGLRQHADGDGAVLIAGAGHTRKDRGVPWYLAQVGLDALSVRFLPDSERGPDDLTDLPYDLVWLTPPRADAEGADPCEDMAGR